MAYRYLYLSESEKRRLARYRTLWRRHSPADRVGAEEALRALYRRAGLAVPERMVWTGSPQALIRAAADQAGGRAIWHAFAGAATEPAWQAIWSELETDTHAAVWRQFDGSLWRGYQSWQGGGWPGGLSREPQVGDTFEVVAVGVGPATKDVVSLWQCVSSRGGWDHRENVYFVWSDWFGDVLPLAAFANEGLGLPGSESISPLLQLARCAGPWIARERAAFLCERPTVLALDEGGERLHCADGPALAWPDGTASYFWHGIRVSEQTILAPETLDAATILGEQNAEVRRVMLERYGLERFLRDGTMKRIDRAADGSSLWRTEIDDDEDLVLVELVNTTPEPDGSHKHYVLRVPPETQTVHTAAAWTFGLDENDYQLTAAS